MVTCRPKPNAFTLIEAMVAMTVMAVAGSALLLSMAGSMNSTDDALEQTIAQGVAQQLMDEVLGCRYAAVGAGGYQWPLGPSATETIGPGRSRYDDVDDYCAGRAQPFEDPWAVDLGSDDGRGDLRHPAFRVASGYFDRWQEAIDVYYVSPDDLATRLPSGWVSDYRAVEVRIYRIEPEGARRELARLRRVIAYVPPLS